MILEALEWIITPSTLLARRSGLLAGQIAIRHRAQRCRALWHSHLTATRNAIRTCLERKAKPIPKVMVMGSGHLHDCSLDDLLHFANQIVLVDIAHPIELYWHRWRHKGRIELVTRDLSFTLRHAMRGQTTLDAPDPAFAELVRQCDVVISLNLLSQLPIGAHDLWSTQGLPEDTIDRQAGMIVKAHYDLLKKAPHALLITDRIVRLRGVENGKERIGGWQDLLYGVSLPEGHDTWLWTIASPQERGDAYWEERQVSALEIIPN